MLPNFKLLETTSPDQTPDVCMIGYGTFLQEAIKDLAAGRRPIVWGEHIQILDAIKVVGFRRLWPGEPTYPVIQKADGMFFYGLLFEIYNNQLIRFDQIEGVPTLYTREQVTIQFRGQTIPSFIYVPTENTLNYVLRQYDLTGIEPGVDDWVENLRKTFSPEEIQVFPKIFREIK